MSEQNSTRRRFLIVLGGSAATLACSGGAAEPEPIGTVTAGTTADFPKGTLTPIGRLPVAVGHDDRGLYAMTLTCSHEGCNMATSGTVDFNGIRCNCHGARFDRQGNVVSGPAEVALVHFQVVIEQDTGEVVIHGEYEVSADERTPLPV